MTTLIERARAYLDAAQSEMGSTTERQAQNWLDADGREARGLKAAHVVDTPNSVFADDIRKHAEEAQAAVAATVQAYLKDGDLDAVIRRLAASHNVHVQQWPDRAV